MTMELMVPSAGQKVIVMKSGILLWVSEERAAALERALASGSDHRFIQIDDKTINSAEIEAIYTPDAYSDFVKVKQGMYQCTYKKWHPKRQECQCARDSWDRMNAEMRRLERQKEFREPTPEERTAGMKSLKSIGEELRARGVLGPTKAAKGGSNKCRMCPNKLSANLKWYCTGQCLAEAKKVGIYGNEE